MRGQEIESLINNIIGKNIKSICKNRNLKKADLAKLLGVSFYQIQKYESGKSRISASNLFLLAQSFNIPIDYFFDGIAINFEGENKWNNKN